MWLEPCIGLNTVLWDMSSRNQFYIEAMIYLCSSEFIRMANTIDVSKVQHQIIKVITKSI